MKIPENSSSCRNYIKVTKILSLHIYMTSPSYLKISATLYLLQPFYSGDTLSSVGSSHHSTGGMTTKRMSIIRTIEASSRASRCLTTNIYILVILRI